MKRLAFGFFAIMLVVLACTTRNLQKPVTKAAVKTDWKHIDSLAQQGLYQSALDETLLSMHQAQDEDDFYTWMKSMVYAAKFHRLLDENGMVKAIGYWEQARVKLKDPYQALAISLLAELYQRHYESLVWQLHDRTYTGQQSDKPLAQWAAKDYLDTIGSLYLSSINAQTPDLNLGDFKDLILWDYGANTLLPTLKELLITRAIDFLAQDYQYPLQDLADYLDSDVFFAPADTFSKLTLSRPGKRHEVARLYQDLLKGASAKKNKEGFLHFDLERLQYVHAQSIHPQKELLYEQALHDVWTKTTGTIQEIDALWPLAQYILQTKSYGSIAQKAEAQRAMLDKIRTLIHQYPAQTGQLKQLEHQLTETHLTLQMEQVNVPGQKILVKISFKNIKSVPFHLMAINDEVMSRLYQLKPEEVRDYLHNLPALLEWSTELPSVEDFEEHSTEIGLDALPAGRYMLVAHRDSALARVMSFQVTNLALKHSKRKDHDEWMVLNRETGTPVSGAEVKFFRQNFRQSNQTIEKQLVALARSDAEGKVIFAQAYQGELELEVKHGSDIWRPEQRAYIYPQENPPAQELVLTQIFTDRAIYRPGQVVHFKAILYKSSNNQARVITNRSVTIRLVDANGEELQALNLQTNTYGSTSGSFIVPATGRLLGNWTIQSSEGGAANIQIEAYKRPSFEILVDTLDKIYKLNDQVNLLGTVSAFSGMELSGAKITYQVRRTLRWRWDPWIKSTYIYQPVETLVTTGEAMTDAHGRFRMSFEAIPDRQVDKVFQPTFIYKVTLSATDISGESQAIERHYELNYAGVLLEVHGPEIVNKWPAHLSVNALNLERKPVDFRGQWELFMLQAPAVPNKARLWNGPDLPLMSESEFKRNFPQYGYRDDQDWKSWPKKTLRKGSFTTGKQPFLQPIPELIDGAYYLEFRGVSGSDSVRQGFWFWVDVRHNIPTVPLNTVLGWRWSKENYQPGEPGSYAVLSAWPQMRWHFELEEEGQNLRHWYWRDETDANQQYFSAASYQVYRASTIYQNRFYAFEFRPQIAMPNQNLDLEFITFRPEILPGSKENWKIRVKGHTEVELLTTMYDDALEAIYPLTWPQTLLQDVYYPGYPWSGIGFDQTYAQTFGLFEYPTFSYQEKGWVRWNWFDFPFYYYGPHIMTRRGGKMTAPAPQMDAMNKKVEEESYALAGKDQAITENVSSPGLRQNLGETVFFYAHLLPDSLGFINIPFTMNEALTRWNWNLYAHTPNLKTGYLTQKVITRKLLMVTPNVPRMVYQDDRVLIPMRVDNLSSERLEVENTLEIIDPISGRNITALFVNAVQIQSVELEPGSSKVVYWRLHIPDDYTQPVQIRFWAKSAGHTDGEARTLPILSKKILVTDTRSLWTNPGESKSMDLQWLKRQGLQTPFRLTVEYTPQPVWLALQALPYLQDQTVFTTDALIEKWMAMVCGRYLFNQYPQVKTVVRAWINQGDVKSPLETNPELKSLLLSETPWVLEGKDETQTIRQLAFFLEENQVDAEIRELERQILDRFTPEGGLTWYPGGRPSPYITSQALEIWGWLFAQNIVDRNLYVSWSKQAFTYLDQTRLMHFNQDPQRDKPVANEEDVHFLYLHSLYPDVELLAGLAKHVDQLYSSAATRWTQYSVYSQSALGLAARNSRPELTLAIQKSLIERAIKHEEQGLTWKHNDLTWWYQQPLESQVLALNLLSGGDYQDLVRQGLKWLISQKETQHWASGRATSLAILRLMQTKDPLPTTPQFSLQVGSHNLSQMAGTPGTGYIKKSWTGKELNGALDMIKIENLSGQPGWGGAYLQYWVDQNEVTSQGTGLKINRSFYRVDQQLKVTKLSNTPDIKPGDRVRIVLTVVSDRPLDYVMIKDLRASIWEPLQRLSATQWRSGLTYYQTLTDGATLFFLDHLPKGTSTFEYDVYVNNLGDVNAGFTQVQSFYAPKFTARSTGDKIQTLRPQ